MSGRKAWVKNPKTALWAGIGFYLAGSILLYDAFERRGRDRPFGLRFLPGV